MTVIVALFKTIILCITLNFPPVRIGLNGTVVVLSSNFSIYRGPDWELEPELEII